MRKGRKPGQHAEKKTSVARSEKRTRKTPSARQENKLRGTDGATANEAPTRKPSNQAPWNGVRHGQRSPPQETEQTTEGERRAPRLTKHPAESRTKHRGGTACATANEAPRRTPHDAPRGNGWTRGERRTPQDAERRPSVERMEPRTTTHPAGSRTTPLRGKDGAKDNEEPLWKGWSQGQRIIYVERIEIRIEKNSLNDMFLSIFSGRMPNNALQRTPLARPPELGAMLGRRGAPSLVPVCEGRQQRR